MNRRIEVGENEFAYSPEGNACKFCGKAIDSYVAIDADQAEIIARTKQDRKFRAEVILLSELARGNLQKDFNESSVFTAHEYGHERKQKVFFVLKTDLDAFFNTVIDSKMKIGSNRFIHLMSCDGEWTEGMKFSKLEELPVGLPYEIISQYHKTKSVQLEYGMKAEDQLRPEQAHEILSWYKGELEKARGEGTSASQQRKAIVFSNLSSLITKAKEDAKKNNISLDDEEEGAEKSLIVGGSVRRRLGFGSSIHSSPHVLQKPRLQATAKVAAGSRSQTLQRGPWPILSLPSSSSQNEILAPPVRARSSSRRRDDVVVKSEEPRLQLRRDDVVFNVDGLGAMLSNTGKSSTSAHVKEGSRIRRERRELSVESYMEGKFDDRVLVPACRSAESFWSFQLQAHWKHIEYTLKAR